MKSSTVQIRHEERIISRFCALRVSRYMLCILLFPLYFIHYPAALYPLAALLVLPPFLNLICSITVCRSQKPDFFSAP